MNITLLEIYLVYYKNFFLYFLKLLLQKPPLLYSDYLVLSEQKN